MKGELIFNALFGLRGAGLSVAEFFAMMAGGMTRRGMRRARLHFHAAMREYDNKKDEQRRLVALIAQLRYKGFIVGNGRDRGQELRITKLGRSKLFHLEKKMGAQLIPSRKYARTYGSSLLIIVFDIPEFRRRERDWLRDALRNIGFTMLQRSAWIGKVRLPEEFVADLNRLRLLQNVEILKVSRRGDLQKIV